MSNANFPLMGEFQTVKAFSIQRGPFLDAPFLSPSKPFKIQSTNGIPALTSDSCHTQEASVDAAEAAFSRAAELDRDGGRASARLRMQAHMYQGLGRHRCAAQLLKQALDASSSPDAIVECLHLRGGCSCFLGCLCHGQICGCFMACWLTLSMLRSLCPSGSCFLGIVCHDDQIRGDSMGCGLVLLCLVLSASSGSKRQRWWNTRAGEQIAARLLREPVGEGLFYLCNITIDPGANLEAGCVQRFQSVFG